jgi:hypothetical protein
VLTTTYSSRRVMGVFDSPDAIVRSSTIRRPTLDDVYLRLTGGRMNAVAA